MDDEMQFKGFIRSSLAKNPEWLRSALDAVSAGMSQAVATANERAADYDLAFRSALSLADPARLSADAKEMLSKAVVGAIKKHGGNCEIEERSVKRLSK